MNRRSLISLTTAACLFAGLAVSSCGDDTDGTGSTGGDSPTVTVEGAWARTSPMMADAGAAYVSLTSSVDDALIGVSVDPSVAATIEMHETRMAEMPDATMPDATMTDATMTDATMTDATMTDATMAPAMEMVQVDRIELPAGETVTFAPGGLHLMMLDLPAPLELGQNFTVTLTFEEAAEQQVQVTVRDEAP